MKTSGSGIYNHVIRTIAALLLLSPLVAQASCESVKADIAQKIIANGVPESGFRLDIVANDRAGGLVVGHCENDSQKIVYVRTDDDGSVAGASGYDAPSP